MKRLILFGALCLPALLAGCIHNDLPYPVVTINIEAIEAGIRDDKATNLQTYKREIMETLNGAVILRYSYAEGVTEHTLTEDREVHRAVALLDDGKEYARILHEQDTVRK